MMHKIPKALCGRLPRRQGFASAAAEPLQQEQFQSFRTTENNPANHTVEHIARFYRMPAKVQNKLFLNGGLPKAFELQAKTFAETCVMVRKPAVDIINCLNNADYSKPVNRYVIFGKLGTGKSLTLAHVMHYASDAGFLIVHVPWVPDWMRRNKEVSNSESRPGLIELPIDTAEWLVNFKMQNLAILNNPELKISKEYVWSKREVTPKDSTLLELVDHGINRVKFASDTVVFLTDEIKLLSSAGKIKTFVGIDGFNSFYYPHTRVYLENKVMVKPERLVLTEAFLNITKFDWCNGAVAITVDELACLDQDKKSYMPRYLLGKVGFEHFDPFVPIEVSDYNETEFTSCMDYFRERRWVQPYPGQDKELAILSSLNPYRLMQICAPL